MSRPVWGVPWHGRIEGGLLALPNGTTKPWPQPAGVDLIVSGQTLTYYENAGYTYLQRMPWAVAVPRSPAEQAEDQAAGRQWPDGALISGPLGSAYLHSLPVGGWIYGAPDGSRWLITGAGGDSSWEATAGVAYRLGVTRFGDFGQARASYSTSIGLTTAQMGQPTWDTSQDTYEQRYARLESIRPDGGAAIVRLHSVEVRLGFAGSTVTRKNIALGFLQITLSGTPGVDFAATLTVLRTAAQTAGTAIVKQAAYSVAQFGMTITGQSVADYTVNDYPTCSGYLEGTETRTLVSGAGDYATESYPVTSDTSETRVTGRIVDLWFTPAGAVEEVALDCAYVTRYALSAPTRSYQATYLYQSPDSAANGVCTLAGTTAWIWTDLSPVFRQDATETNANSSSATTTVTATLRAGARSVSLTSSIVHSIDDRYSRTISDSQLSAVSGSRLETQRWDSFGWSREDSSQAVYSDNTPGAGLDRVPIGQARADTFDALLSGVGAYSNDVASLRLAKWSNGAIGFVSTNRVDEIRWSEALTPGGLVAGAAETTPQAAGAWSDYRPYGAWNPLTGEAVIASATPVSWT